MTPHDRSNQGEESMPETYTITETDLYRTTDAAVWTDAFIERFGDGPCPDWGTMVGWFANAIETGRAHDATEGVER